MRTDDILGYRLVVGQRILVPSTGVRLSLSQPCPPSHIWPVRLAVQDAPSQGGDHQVRIWYGLPNVQGLLRKFLFVYLNTTFASIVK